MITVGTRVQVEIPLDSPYFRQYERPGVVTKRMGERDHPEKGRITSWTVHYDEPWHHGGNGRLMTYAHLNESWLIPEDIVIEEDCLDPR